MRTSASRLAAGAPRRGSAEAWIVRGLAGAALVLARLECDAQTIDDVRVAPHGPDAVARVTFNATVQFLRQQPIDSTSLYRITFNLIAGDEPLINQTIQESKRIAAAGSVPEFTLTYAPSRGRRTKELTLQLRAPALVVVKQGPSSRTIDIVFTGRAAGAEGGSTTWPSAPAARMAPTAPRLGAAEKRYAVTLQSVPVNELDKLPLVPGRFARYEAFGSNTVVAGVTMAETNLGYFASIDEAEAVRKGALDQFPQAIVIDLAKRREDLLRSTAAQSTPPPAASEGVPFTVAARTAAASSPSALSVGAPAQPTPPPLATPTPVRPALVGSVEVEARAAKLMADAREALQVRRYEDAIDHFNQLLLLPPNSLSQEGQELVGLAWERAGDLSKARVEYTLYLKLFAQSEGAQRVAQRLASLEGGPAAPSKPAAATDATGAVAAAMPATSATRGNRFTGNIAQYYYGGKARSQSLVNLAAGIDQSTLTKTTESAIVTSVDLGARYANDESETRVVFRGTGSLNLVASSNSIRLLDAAYLDYKRSGSGLAIRVGRQAAISGGLLGLFDGVSATYPVTTHWKVDLMGGVPANTLVSSSSERLLAALVDADGLFDHWGGDFYVIEQTSEGIANRRAVGLETRYSDELFSTYSLLEYDALFRKVNALSLQGSFQAPSQTTITLLLDSRKAPPLQMTNALISAGAMSLKQLLQMATLDEVRAAAEATTAQADQALFSVSRPVSAKWQAAMDLRYSAIGALPAVGNFEATPATGAQYGATLQLTGSNLYSPRDINNFNVSVLTSPFFKGAQFLYSNLTGLRDNDLTLEPSLRFYTQRDNQGVRLNRFSPGMRLSYQFSRRMSVLGEGIVEHSTTEGPLNHDNTNSIFFYIGYRYERF